MIWWLNPMEKGQLLVFCLLGHPGKRGHGHSRPHGVGVVQIRTVDSLGLVKNEPLNDEIARKIDKKPVLCFLKDYDRSFESRFERAFLVVKLYAEEEANYEKTQPSSNLVVDAIVSAPQGSTFVAAEKEQQLFSPSTKRVIEEIATTVGIDQRTTTVGIMFGKDSDETEDVQLAEKVPSPTHETVVAASGSESPVKKLRNAGSHN